jgi:hypothetical protein
MSIVDDLTQTQKDVLEAIDGLTAEELEKESTIGKWSARDVVIHIAMWNGEALKALAVWRTGHDYDWTYANEYLKMNDFWKDMTKKLTSTQVIQMYNLVQGALIADVSCISDDIWAGRGGIPDWLSGITIEHNKWHLEKLRGYKKSLRG